MATEVRIPSVSDTVKQGKVVTLLVAPGDRVAFDQPLIELETDKAVVEIPAPVAGTVSKLAVAPGQTVTIGEVIAWIDADGEGAGGPPAAQHVQAVEPPASPTGTAAPAPPVATPASDTQAPGSPPAPAIANAVGPVNSKVAQATVAEATSPASAPFPANSREVAPASPSVRRLAREIGIDIDSVRGTGPGGRIGEADVKAHAKRLLSAAASGGVSGGVSGGAGVGPEGSGAAAAAAAWLAPRPLPDFARWGPIRREALTRVREITADAMANAWATVPQVTQFDKADVTELEDFRRRHAAQAEAQGGKLTMTAILLKVVAGALKAFPQFNASLDWPARELILKEYVHVGVAVDTPHGLLVPVIRDVDRKSLLQLGVELTAAAEKARTRKIPPADLEGGNFTISNLGGIGGTGFSPIVYPPQVAILGVARAGTDPVFREDRFEPRLLLPLSLTYDHRVIDGADGARFLRWIAEALQQPMLLVLGD